jgi:predicted extracellular nuclease
MILRIATFNVENMFKRPSIMNLPTWDEGKAVLEDYQKLSDLIQKQNYSPKNKTEMLKIMKRQKMINPSKNTYLIINKIRGKFLSKPHGKPPFIVANGQNDWIGWVSLKTEAIREKAIDNTARVIKEVNASIVGLVEVEDRILLGEFNDKIIPRVGGTKYNHYMLVDGNDSRGIDVGILSDYEIESMVSHVDDEDSVGTIFSRDCPEYRIKISNDKILLVLINHFKSKGYGSQASSNKKRKRQAQRVADIYKKRLKEGYEYVAIMGDFNDSPENDPLSPLLRPNSKLTDIMELQEFYDPIGRPGTYGSGTKSGKLDYILLSPKLVTLVESAGIERRGIWAGVNGDIFPHFDEIKNPNDAASDHASLWVDLNL